MAAVLDIELRRHIQEMRESWQCRAIANTEGLLNRILLSVIAHNYDEAMPVILQAIYGHVALYLPGFVSAAKINKAGQIVADWASKDGKVEKAKCVFSSQEQMQFVFRTLADKMKLSDLERIEMFKCAQRWVVADQRLDPNMDPRDPDAKRLVYH